MRLSRFPTARFVLRRAFHGVIVLVCIAVLDFSLLHLAPGDMVEILAGEAGGADAGYVARLRAEMGLDQPFPVQLGVYLAHLARFDLGWSGRYQASVTSLIVDRLPATLTLMVLAIVFAVVLGALLGMLAARRVNSLADGVISVLSLLSYATPLFWLGLMLIVLFAVTLGWLPTGGMSGDAALSGRPWLVDLIRHAVMPTVTLGLFFMAIYTRLMRASILEVKEMDFVRMARAKGLRPSRIAFRHVFRNAMLPLVTLLGAQVGSMVGGAVVVEMVFSWPGLGRLAFDAVLARDLNLLMGIVLMSSILVVTINILVDLTYAKLDPRIEVR